MVVLPEVTVYYSWTMSRAFEYIPFDEPQGDFDCLAADAARDMSPDAGELDTALVAFQMASDHLDKVLVTAHHTPDVFNVDVVSDAASVVIGEFYRLAGFIAPPNSDDVTAGDNYGMAKLIAHFTADRGRLLQATTGVTLFTNLTEEHMIEDVMYGLCDRQYEVETYEGLDLAAAQIFETLIEDQLQNLQQSFVSKPPAKKPHAARRLTHLFTSRQQR